MGSATVPLSGPAGALRCDSVVTLWFLRRPHMSCSVEPLLPLDRVRRFGRSGRRGRSARSRACWRWRQGSRSAPRRVGRWRLLRVLMVAPAAVRRAVASSSSLERFPPIDALPLAQVGPDEWVEHAAINALSISIILHVAIGRRWPFLRPPQRSRASTDTSGQPMRSPKGEPFRRDRTPPGGGTSALSRRSPPQAR